MLLFLFVYLNNLDYVRNQRRRTLESFLQSKTSEGKTQKGYEELFERKGGEVRGGSQEMLIQLNQQANNDNYWLWVWNYQLFLSQSACAFI